MEIVCRMAFRGLAVTALGVALIGGPAGCRAPAPKVQSDAFKCGEHHGRGSASGGVHAPNSIVYGPGGKATTLDGRPVDSRGQVIRAGHQDEPQQ